MKKIVLILLSIAVFCFVGCTNDSSVEISSLQNEIDNLRKDLENLKSTIIELQKVVDNQAEHTNHYVESYPVIREHLSSLSEGQNIISEILQENSNRDSTVVNLIDSMNKKIEFLYTILDIS